jgi:cell wall-associated NlpC family hydrolase
MQRRQLVPALFLILALAIVAAALPSVAAASPISDKKAQARQIAEQIQQLDTKMEFAVEQYDAATQKLAAVQAQIVENQKELRVARYNLLVARQNLMRRVVAMYKQDKTSVIDVLLATHSFDDLLTEMNAMDKLGQSDSDTVASIESLKKEITRRRARLLADGKQAKKLVAQRAAMKQQIAGDLQQRKDMLQGVKAEITKLQAEAAAAARLAAERAAAAAAAAASAPRQIAAGSGTTSSAGAHGGVVGVAQQYLGVPYVWGGASPAGFDCSGLAMYCYAQVGVYLPHNAAMQYASITHVAHGSEQPGDLVFFGYSAGGIHHVGIYVGGGSMIDAPYTGAVVRYDSAFGGDYFASGRP